MFIRHNFPYIPDLPVKLTTANPVSDFFNFPILNFSIIHQNKKKTGSKEVKSNKINGEKTQQHYNTLNNTSTEYSQDTYIHYAATTDCKLVCAC